jgi:hypothetical protein
MFKVLNHQLDGKKYHRFLNYQNSARYIYILSILNTFKTQILIILTLLKALDHK